MMPEIIGLSKSFVEFWEVEANSSRFYVCRVRHRIAPGPVMRLTKPERHAMRRAIRSVQQITELQFAELNPAEWRIARAEMRKRGFKHDMVCGVHWRPVR
jgi:hypothetical protein